MTAEWLDMEGTLLRKSGPQTYEAVIRVTFTEAELTEVPLDIHLARIPQAVLSLCTRSVLQRR